MLQEIENYFKKFLFPSRFAHRRAKSASAIRSGYSVPKDKQAALEALCEKLLQKEDLILSGKLQLIGLEKVKRRMGKRWSGFRPIIFRICEEAIRRYIGQSDIYLRYQNQDYILLFAETDSAVNELRVALIAAEIKKNLALEYDLEDIDVTGGMVPVCASRENGFAIVECPQGICPVNTGVEKSSSEMSRAPLPRKIEIDPYPPDSFHRVPLDLGVDLSGAAFQSVRYLPVWDHHKKQMTAFLCLAGESDHPETSVIAHKDMYQEQTSAACKGMFDQAILASVIGWLRDSRNNGRYDIICPVHYDSLIHGDSKTKYRTLCQKITEPMKERILFMLLDIPAGAPWTSLSQFASPLKTYGRVLCAQLPINGKIDFDPLRRAGFDHVGFILDAGPSREARLAEARQFILRAKKYLIPNTFALEVNDPASAAVLTKAGVRFLSGHAISESLIHPSDCIDILQNSQFRAWQTLSGKNGHQPDHG